MGSFIDYCKFLTRIYGLADLPTIFHNPGIKRPDTGEQTPCMVTNSNKQKQKGELIEVLKKLEKAGYRLCEVKSEWFKSEVKTGGQCHKRRGHTATARQINSD